jgi:hypothetical protein
LRAGGVYEVHPDGEDWTVVRYEHWSHVRNGGFRRPKR